MIKEFFIISFILLSLPSFSQDEERKPVRIHGRIVDSYNLPVSFAHIYNRHRNTGTISDYYGTFNIGSYPGDTLTVSALAYKPLDFVVPDTIRVSRFSYELILEPDTVMLKEQTIYPWPETYEEFRAEILDARPIYEIPKALMIPWFARGELTNYAYPEGGIRISGPVSLLYSVFSKEAKTRKALAQIRIYELVRKRYNPELVSRITGLKDMLEINKLIDYCNLEPGFISKSTDYELYSAIYHCYLEYVQTFEN
jgi:hypothetical protein